MRGILCWLLLFNGLLMAGDRTTSVQVLSQNSQGCVLQYQGTAWHASATQGRAIAVRFNSSTGLMQKGCPDLPQVSISLNIPFGKKISWTISDLQYTDYSNMEILPSKGNLLRNIDPKTVAYEYGDVYQQDAFFPHEICTSTPSYIFRNLKGQGIHFQPVQYNPIKKILRVYTHYTLHVNYEEEASVDLSSSKLFDPSFEQIYQGHFINYTSSKPLYSPMQQFGSMLIVCPNQYLNAIQSFVDWKRQKGMHVYVAATDTILNGVSNASIYALAKDYYQDHSIAYMLLVGDEADIPPYQGNVNGMTIFGPSDMAYGYISGLDHFPELIVGRFSGESVEDIQTQVQRTVLYEKYPNLSSNWYQKQIGIASEQGDALSDDGQLDYEHICDIIDSNMNQYYYVDHQGYFDGSQTLCNDGPGNPMATDIVSEINGGIGLLNYCGHGSSVQMSTSGFSTLDVPDLTNQNGQWPFMFNVACYNGTFMGQTCLGEALLRARNAQGTPTGALATVMSSILQYWNPPMQGQDEMNAVLRGARSNNKSTCYGPIVVSGLMSTMEQYNTAVDPNDGNQTADTWIIFGDPSVEVRTKNEGVLQCTHSGWMQKNSWDFFVACPTEGARISFYYQGDILGSALVENGVAHLIFSPVAALDSITVTATKQNWQPYFGRIDVVDFPTSSSDLNQSKVTIYPVPVQDQLHVEWALHEGFDQLELMDITGRVLQQIPLSSSSVELNTTNLDHGKYLIRLYGKKQGIYSFVK